MLDMFIPFAIRHSRLGAWDGGRRVRFQAVVNNVPNPQAGRLGTRSEVPGSSIVSGQAAQCSPIPTAMRDGTATYVVYILPCSFVRDRFLVFESASSKNSAGQHHAVTSKQK